MPSGLERSERLLERFGDLTVLVIGDVMLDRYVYGAVERISPEAPIPVMRVHRTSTVLGGAGNVARNVAELGGEALLLSVVGADRSAAELRDAAAGVPRLEARLLASDARATTVKVRFIAGGQQLLRADEEDVAPIAADEAAGLVSAASALLPRADILLISDYAKGVLPEPVVRSLIAAARAAGRPVIVDPKARDLRRYDGATVVKPNARELADASGLPVGDDASVEAAARRVLDGVAVDALFITRSERGASVVARDRPALHLPARGREVYDVSGAGDTALAALGLMLAAEGSLEEAAAMANRAAGIVVGKTGTASVSLTELRHALRREDLLETERKILSADEARDLASTWRAAGLRVGFTNGCFDLLHPGHVSLLAFARARCDRLLVGLNADASVRRLKGPARPINGETARATVLASLRHVDGVTLFEDDTPLALIEAVRPDLLVKGADYTVEQVVGSDRVRAWGGEVALAPVEAGHSTTAMAHRVTSARPPAAAASAADGRQHVA